MSAKVIAEIGVNHNGELALALELIDAAHDAGADIVKFQTFRAERLALAKAPKAGYQLRSTCDLESQFEMLQGLELSEADHFVLRDKAISVGIDFLSTPFDFSSLDFLTRDLGLQSIKVGSSDALNLALLLRVGWSGRDLILSTGMSTIDEVQEAIAAYAFGLVNPGVSPKCVEELEEFAQQHGILDLVYDKAIVLHCTSEYPAPLERINLRAMHSLAAATGLRVGLSDHSLGIHASVAAVARDAVMIEKHMTLDVKMAGPDHAASLEPAEFAQMVAAIRAVERALGSQTKALSVDTLENRRVAGKGLYAGRSLCGGEVIHEEDIAILRPSTSVPLRNYWSLVGSRAVKDMQVGDAF